jgi:DNA-binding MarR family transcriptional regulator
MDDEIDRMGTRLRARRPSLDTSTLARSDRVIRLARYLEIGRREALATRQLEVWEYDVLLALRAAESTAGLSPSALMAASQVASGTVTNRIDRLARRGFVSREPDPNDHRGVLVRLSTTGRRRIDQATTDIAEAESALWNALPQRRREQLTMVLREVLVEIESAG